MSTSNLSFIGLADVYLKPFAAAAAALAVGSVSKCEITHTEDEKRQQNYGRDGGTLSVNNRLTKVGLALTLQNVSKANLALATRGTASEVASGSVLDETVTAYKGGLVALAHTGATGHVVTNTAGTTTYAKDVDYKVTGAGIVILESDTITDGQSLKVDYSYPTQDVVEALTTGAPEYTLFFDGLNEADNNRDVTVRIHRLKFKLAKAIGLISNDYVNLEVEGEALIDAGQVGAGVSKFYKWVYRTA